MHVIKSWFVRKLIAGVGVTAVLIVLCVAGVMNWDYGYSLGGKMLAAHALGILFIQADVVMAISPFFFFAAKANKEYTKAVAAAVLFVIGTGVSSWCAVSQIGFHRDEASSGREVVSTNYDDLRKQIEAARATLGFIPQARPEGTVKADLQGLKSHRLWNQTSECEDAAGKTAREFCQGYSTLQGELANAVARTKQVAVVEALVAKSEKKTEEKGSQLVSKSDAGAFTWAAILGISVDTAKAITAAMCAMLPLSLGSLGLYVFVGTLREPIVVEPEAPPAATPPPLPPISDLFPVAEADKLMLEAPPKQLEPPPPPKVEKAPTGPILAPSQRSRAEPTAEGRELLDLIDFPRAPIRKSDLRKRDERDHLGWRFYVWLVAYELIGTFPWQEIDLLYVEFTQGDHREGWSPKMAKSLLAQIPYKWVLTSPPPDTQWTIAKPNIAKLREQLAKRGISVIDGESSVIDNAGQVRRTGTNVVSMQRAVNESEVPDGWS